MTLTSKPLAFLVLVILFGAILITSLMGWWQTESTKEVALFTDGEYAGLPNPADIRGSYTFGDIERNFGIRAKVLAQAFQVNTTAPASYAIKDLEVQYADSDLEIGTASVRLFVAFYLGLPINIDADIYLPRQAADLLMDRPLTTQQREYVQKHIADNTLGESQSTSEPEPGTESEATLKENDSGDWVIKGKTTYGEILAWGLPRETIEKIIGVPIPDDGVKIKDHCSENGLDFETIKLALQSEVDKLK